MLCVMPFLTVRNSVPAFAPTSETQVRVIYPNGGETVSGMVMIQWEVLNPPEETLRFKLEYWYWKYAEWVLIVSGITGTTYPWDTRTLEEDGQYVIRVTLTSVTPAVSDESDNSFIVENGDLPRVQVFYPNGGEIISGTVLITWSVRNPSSYALTFELYYWDSREWQLIDGKYQSVSYSWDTTQYKDGDWYQIKVICHSEVGTAEDISDAPFDIRNGVESAHVPSVHVTFPNGGETLTGEVLVTWTASDPDDDPLSYSLRCWDGSKWHRLAQNVQTTNWTWNTLLYENGTEYIIEVIASDGTYLSSDQSNSFFVVYHRPPLIDILSPRGINGTSPVLSDTAWINWTVTNPANYSLTYGIDLYIKNEWLPIARNLTTTAFEWDTRKFPDGKRYKLRVLGFYSTKYSEGLPPSDFEIDNLPNPPGNVPEVELAAPNGGETWKGLREIRWVAADPDGNPMTYDLYFWNGTRWTPLAHAVYNMSYSWDTSRLPSRTDYRVLVIAFDGVDLGVDYSDATFTIGGNPPLAEFLYPLGGETLQGDVTVAWTAFDPDRRVLVYTLEYYHHKNWTLLATNLTETTFHWDTRTVENGKDYQLRLTVNNSLVANIVTTEESLTIQNNFAPMVTVMWPNGGEDLHGVVEIQWNATDPNDPPEHLTFTISYYLNDTTWVIIAEDLHEPHFRWNTTSTPDLEWTKIRIHASDGNLTAVDDSDDGFTIRNAARSSTGIPTSKPSSILRVLVWVAFFLGIGLLSVGVYGAGVWLKNRSVSAYEEIQEIEGRIQQVETALTTLKQNENHMRRSYPGWPRELKRISARLDKIEEKAAIVDFLEQKRTLAVHRADVLSHLETMRAQAQRIIAYIEEKRNAKAVIGDDEAHVSIEKLENSDELQILLNNSEKFIDIQRLQAFPNLTRDILHVIKHLQLTPTEHQVGLALFSEERVSAFLENVKAFLDAQRKLKTMEETDSQIISYNQGLELYQETVKIARERGTKRKELTELKTQLNELNKRLEPEERRRKPQQLDKEKYQLELERRTRERE